MTISSTTRVAGPFIGNGSTAIYPFSFKVFDETDLFVLTLNVSTGVIATLTLTQDYTVTLNPDQDSSPGGSIKLSNGNLGAGYTLTITTDLAALQGTYLTNGGGFYPDVMNAALDYLTILVQQLNSRVDRSLQFPVVDDEVVAQLPPAAQRKGMVLGFASDGSPALFPYSTAALPGTLFAGPLAGTIDGVNKVFTFTNGGIPLGRAPLQADVRCNISLTVGYGYNLGPSAGQVTFTKPPQPVSDGSPADVLFAQGVF